MSATKPVVALITSHGDPESEAQGVAEALEAAGLSCEPRAVDAHSLFPAVLSLAARRSEVVALSLVRRLGGDPQGAPLLAGLLALHRVRAVGSPAAALTCTLDRRVTKAILYAAGIPTAGGRIFRSVPTVDSVRDMAFPLIVKPVRVGAAGSTAPPRFSATPEELCDEVRRMLEADDEPVIGEVYLEGRQFRVPVVGEGRTARPLPCLEFELTACVEGPAPFAVRASRGRFRCPAEVGEHVKVALETAALAAFRAMECRDLAAVNLRFDSRGRAHAIGVDPLPDLTPGDEIARAVEASGDHLADFLARVVDAAWQRP